MVHMFAFRVCVDLKCNPSIFKIGNCHIYECFCFDRCSAVFYYDTSIREEENNNVDCWSLKRKKSQGRVEMAAKNRKWLLINFSFDPSHQRMLFEEIMKKFHFWCSTWKFQQLTNIKMTQWIISRGKSLSKTNGREEKLWKQFLCFINGYNYHSLDAINNKQCRGT